MEHARTRRAAVMASLAVGLLATGPAAAIDLLSHRAIYRLSLLTADRGGGYADVQGGLVIELKHGCEGWISNQRLGFAATTSDGPGFTYDVRFSSWESEDATRLRFSVRSFEDGQVSEEYRGKADLSGPGGAGMAEFALPEQTEPVQLPAGTLFPTEHVRRLIEVAQKGERLSVHDVFDGSGEEGLNRITAVIGAPFEHRPGTAEAERRWRVTLAYHEPGDDDTLPAFEAAFELNKAGVLNDIVLDYGELVLKGEMEKLETLAAERCE